MEAVLAIAAIVVALASPAAAYFGARQGHKSTVKTAELAAGATRAGHQSAERIAAEARDKEEADNRRDAFWRSIDFLNKTDDQSKKLGMNLLAGLLGSGKLDETFRLMALEVIAPLNHQNVNSLEPPGPPVVAQEGTAEDAG